MSKAKLIHDALISGFPVEVVFTKVNGDTRIINGTLSDNLIPDEERPTSDRGDGFDPIDIEKTKTLKIFDLDLEGWRSFRVNSVKSITILF